jgi:ribosome biogenesis protein MAK21
MGKSTKRPGQGPKPPTNVAKPAADSLPAFDEKALLSLTKKIEKGFGSKKNLENKPENQGQQKKTEKNAAPAQQPKNKNKTKEEPKQGNKRDARGNRKPASNESTKANGSKKLQNGNGKADSDILLQEILALGGTEEDLQLVADALSDDDLDESSTSAPDKSFKADLAKFVAGLGIDTTVEQDASESEPEEVNDDEWESSGEESSDEPAPSAKVQRTGSTEGKQTVEENSPEPSRSEVPGRLVGISSLLAID